MWEWELKFYSHGNPVTILVSKALILKLILQPYYNTASYITIIIKLRLDQVHFQDIQLQCNLLYLSLYIAATSRVPNKRSHYTQPVYTDTCTLVDVIYRFHCNCTSRPSDNIDSIFYQLYEITDHKRTRI